MKLLKMKGIVLLMFVSAVSLYMSAQDWALYGVNGREFHLGLAVSYGGLEDRTGYIDASGNLVIPRKFKYADPFLGLAARVVTDEGEALINTRGEYIIEPGNYRIQEEEKIPGTFYVYDKSTDKGTYFDGNRFITGFSYDYLYVSFPPFISMSSKEDVSKKLIYNSVTQEIFENGVVLPRGKYLVVILDKDVYVYDKNGEPIDKSKFQKSSKGAELFYAENGFVGIRNSVTGDVIQPERFTIADQRFNNSPWVNDIVVLKDSINPNENRILRVFDATGKLIISTDDKTQFFFFDEEFIYKTRYGIDNNDGNVFYDYKGNEIKELRGTMPFKVALGYYYYPKNNILYDINKHKQYKNVTYCKAADGMLRFYNSKENKYFYMNLQTGKVLGPYEKAELFNEGVAVVEDKNKNRFIINKNGKKYTFPSNIEILGEKMSEGVIRAREKSTGVDGFIYNTFGHGSWTYNQTGGEITDWERIRIHDQATELIEKGKFAQAMNKYYMLMMLRPDDKLAFTNYVFCLYNLGNLDEALTAVNIALSYWPDYENAQKLKQMIISRIEYQAKLDEEAREDIARKSDNSMSVWDAIGNFANALNAFFGGYNQQSAYVPSYSSGENSMVIASSGNYQSQYDQWARIAEMHYNSLTNLGYSTTSSSGKKSGTSGNGKVSSGNYVRMKRLLREAQKEMREIRRKASREGITIVKSNFEDASVSY